LPVPAPDSVLLKQPKDFTLIGTPPSGWIHRTRSTARRNSVSTLKYWMKFAAIAISPAFGGKLRSVNEAAALAVRGVHQVVRIDNAVAVVADHTWSPKRGSRQPRSDGMTARMQRSAVATSFGSLKSYQGNLAPWPAIRRRPKSARGAAQRFDVVYQLPFLAHAAMEPMNCTVHLRKDRSTLDGTQAPTLTQALVAELTGLPKDAIKIHNHLLGGGLAADSRLTARCSL